jgi:lysylphosphatidylglycerol synthetase-like protein (DUF2156 family)
MSPKFKKIWAYRRRIDIMFAISCGLLLVSTLVLLPFIVSASNTYYQRTKTGIYCTLVLSAVHTTLMMLLSAFGILLVTLNTRHDTDIYYSYVFVLFGSILTIYLFVHMIVSASMQSAISAWAVPFTIGVCTFGLLSVGLQSFRIQSLQQEQYELSQKNPHRTVY